MITSHKKGDYMATARKLSSGSWRCQVYSHTEEIPLPDGTIKRKRHYKSFTCDVPGPKGKRLCEQMAADWASTKENNHFQNITFEEAAKQYIANRQKVLSPRTIDSYKRIVKNDLKSIMKLPIHTITQEHIQQAINLDAQIHSPKTVRNNHGFISAVLKAYNPSLALHTSLPQKEEPKLYIPSDSEVKKLLIEVENTPLEIPVLLAAFGPLRRGEICALDPSDINGNIVHVHKNLVRAEDRSWVIKSPKSYAGNRYILFPDFVIKKLQQANPICSLTPDEITNKFKYALRRAGLPHFRFHDLRHYSASIQHTLGVKDAYIAERGGWHSVSTLNNIYKHALKENKNEMSQLANDHFCNLYDQK